MRTTRPIFPSEARYVEFFVPGVPATAGSKKAFRHPSTGKIVVVDMSGKRGKIWRREVQTIAALEYGGHLGIHPPFLEGPLHLAVDFYLPAPKADPRRPFHTVRPDATKLLRALEDALTGVLWKDDAQIVQQAVSKQYGETPGAAVFVTEIGPR